MHTDTDPHATGITVTEEVAAYVRERKCDFRVCTSCGGAILLPTSVKPPKQTDLAIKVGEQTIYVSIYQARSVRSISRGMLPRHYSFR
jgi:hypothetical protein